jgi:hypothetical protein
MRYTRVATLASCHKLTLIVGMLAMVLVQRVLMVMARQQPHLLPPIMSMRRMIFQMMNPLMIIAMIIPIVRVQKLYCIVLRSYLQSYQTVMR